MSATDASPAASRGYGIGDSFLLRGIDRGAVLVLAVILAVAVAVPLLSFQPPTSTFYVSPFLLSLIGKYLCYAILALAVGLVWGYGGILSLGHAAFFALGGYAMGMYLMRQIGSRGSYGHPILPDFMVFLNWQELPWFWYGFNHFWFAMIWVVLAPGLLAFVFGWFAFRSRVTGVYLSIITQAMTYALWLLFFRNDTGFGGNNGLTDFKDILGQPVQAPTTRAVLFAASAVALALAYFLCRAVVASKFGRVLVAVRDAESRTRFIGYRAENYKLLAFTLSACMAGIGGALYVPQVGIINPSEFEPANSIEAVVWVAVGGRGTLIGPIIGSILISGLKTYFTGGSVASYLTIAILPVVALLLMDWRSRNPGAGSTPIVMAAVGALLVPLAIGLARLVPNLSPAVPPYLVAAVFAVAATVWLLSGRGAAAGGLAVGSAIGALHYLVAAVLPRGTASTSILVGAALILVAIVAVRRISGENLRRSGHLAGAVVGLAAIALGPLVDLVLPASLASWWPLAVVGAALLVWVIYMSEPLAIGAALGALAGLLLRTPAAQLPLAPYWLFFLGAIFIAVTLFFPRGIVGSLRDNWIAARERRASIEAEEGVDVDPPPPAAPAAAAAVSAAPAGPLASAPGPAE